MQRTESTPARILPPNRLRELREAHGLKAYDIAARCRRDTTTVYRWESGLSSVPDVVKFDLAELYGVGVLYLMGWPQECAEGAKAA